jgi:hypothetical protein
MSRNLSRQGRLGTGLCMHKPVSPVSPGSRQSPGQGPKQWRQWRALGICGYSRSTLRSPCVGVHHSTTSIVAASLR